MLKSLDLKFSLLLWSLILLELVGAHCPKNGIKGSVDGSCYFGINVNETFSGADNFCSTYFYGRLASITSAADDADVQDLARGLFKNSKNVWIGGTYNGSTIEWIDASLDSYQNFQKGTQAGKIILDLVTGNWSTASWNAILPYICLQKAEVSPSTPPPPPPTTSPTPAAVTTPAAPAFTPTPPQVLTTTPSPPTTCPTDSPCPSEWVYAASLKACYKVILRVNFDQANTACTSMGAALASIHSDVENRIVNQISKSGAASDMSFGGLIGGKRTGPGASEWMWIDGTPWNYTMWARGEPNFVNGQEFCLEVYNDDPTFYKNYQGGDEQKWNDLPCTSVLRSAICKKDAKF